MSEKKEVEVIWPAIGSRWVDEVGRELIVTEIHPADGGERSGESGHNRRSCPRIEH